MPQDDPSGGGGFHAEVHGPVNSLIQASQVAISLPERPSVTWPHRVGLIPPLASCRQQRQSDAELAAALDLDEPTASGVVLSGMGGIGKTQLAAAYAWQCWERNEIDLVVWVNATSRESIISTFAQACGEVNGADPPDSYQAAEVFLAGLNKPDAPRWLIVLDDIVDPADLDGLWPPETFRGRTLATTRRRDTALEGNRRARVDVGLFTPAEAKAYFEQKLKHDSDRLIGTAELADDLGHLPLALAQAAAFVLDQPGLTCVAYRELLADRTVRLAELSPEIFPDGYGKSVTAALSLSIEIADSRQPNGLSTALLRLASLLDSAGIPAGLFDTEAARNLLGVAKATPSRDIDNECMLTKRNVGSALGLLHRLSLIDFDGAVVRIHSLVQHVIRDGLDSNDKDAFAYAAADALFEIWPKPDTNVMTSAILRTNTATLRCHAESTLFDPDAHEVLFLAGRSFGETGQVDKALAYFRQLLIDCADAMGHNHITTLTARGSLAHWRGVAGDSAGAVIACQELLKDFLESFGYRHPGTLAARNNYARWLRSAGHVDQAVYEFGKLFEDCLEVLGSADSHTIAAGIEFATSLGESGDSLQARSILESLVPDCERILGQGHLFTLTARSNLANWQGDTGDPLLAHRSLEKLHQDCLRILGSEHPQTIIVRANTANWQGELGDAAGAARALAEALNDRIRVLGLGHPDTVATRDAIKYWQDRI